MWPASGCTVLAALVAGLRADLTRVGPRAYAMRAVRRLRALQPGGQAGQLLALPFYRAHLAAVAQQDALFFLSQRHYLVRGLSAAQRLSAAATHYLAEARSLPSAHLAAIYGVGPGLSLWRREVAGVGHDIRLTGGLDVAHEGAASLSLVVGGERVCTLSFSILPERLLAPGAPAARLAVLVCRKQLTRARAYQAGFHTAFDRSTPAHLVFAALEGLVQARGALPIYGLAAPAHPIWSAALAPHLDAAYCAFLQSLGGQAVSDRAWSITSPARLTPLEDLRPDRRDRAAARRAHAEAIRAAAQAEVARWQEGAALVPALAAG